ncbi:hypothetical protein Bbelb_236890, partial [Branchiostoma belcheri]
MNSPQSAAGDSCPDRYNPDPTGPCSAARRQQDARRPRRHGQAQTEAEGRGGADPAQGDREAAERPHQPAVRGAARPGAYRTELT